VTVDGQGEVARVLRTGTWSGQEWLESGQFLLDLLARTIGRDDLGGVELLDVGCGTVLTKTIIERSLPIGHYTGVDAGSDVIDWLRTNFSDPRFEFHHLNAHNAMYNPGGRPLDGFELIPGVGERRFDLISLFSVFTHLAPRDYVAMLRLLRRHVKDGGKLLFSLFIIDPDFESPFDDREARARATRRTEEIRGGDPRGPIDDDPRFIDELPSEPLKRAVYTRDFALELVDGTGWRVESIHPPHPKPYIQHHMICRPA
jgi:SAM-dependent methyltransferase